MKLVYKFRKPRRKHLDVLCLISKKLYNQANWYIRQDFFHLDNWLRYGDLDYMLKPTQNYQLLKAQTSQQLHKVVDKNWKSFFKGLKEYENDRSKFKGRPRPPHYKKDCDNLVIFTNQNSKIKDNIIILTMSKHFKEKYPEFKDPIKLSIPKYKKKNFRVYAKFSDEKMIV